MRAHEPFRRLFQQETSAEYAAFSSHAFFSGILDGSLPEAAFRIYTAQDALYILRAEQILNEFLNVAPPRYRPVVSACRDGLEAEIMPGETRSVKPAPYVTAHVKYMSKAILLQPFHEGFAALLPCWVYYRDMSRSAVKPAAIENPYRRWLDQYACKSFAELTETMLQTADKMALENGPSAPAGMARAAKAAAQAEINFFDGIMNDYMARRIK